MGGGSVYFEGVIGTVASVGATAQDMPPPYIGSRQVKQIRKDALGEGKKTTTLRRLVANRDVPITPHAHASRPCPTRPQRTGLSKTDI